MPNLPPRTTPLPSAIPPGGLRRTWLRRALLVLMVMLGTSFALLDGCALDPRPAESACQVCCLEEGEYLPVVLETPEGVAEQQEETRPIGYLTQDLREQSREPEHAPPRQG